MYGKLSKKHVNGDERKEISLADLVRRVLRFQPNACHLKEVSDVASLRSCRVKPASVRDRHIIGHRMRGSESRPA